MRFVFVACLCCFHTFLSLSQDTARKDSIVVIDETRDFLPLNLASFLLRDKTGTLTLDSVQLPDADFQRITEEMYSFRQDTNIQVYWYRCTLDNRTGEWLEDLLCMQLGLDSVDVFTIGADGKVQHAASNSLSLTRQRPFFISQQIAIPIELPPGITKVYLRIVNNSLHSHEKNNIVASLADEKMFVNYFLEIRLYQGIVLGMLFLMMILQVFTYALLREITALIFLINLFFTIIYLVLRKNYQFEFDFLAHVLGPLTEAHDFVGMMVGITTIWFGQAFLNTKRDDIVMDRILNAIMIAMGLVGLCMLAQQWIMAMRVLSIYLGFLTGLLMIASSLRSYRRGNRLAIYIFLGFLLLAFVPVVYIVPLPDYLHYKVEESNILYFSEAVRSLIFAIGITDRFYTLKAQVDRYEIEKKETVLVQEKKMIDEKERISSDLHDNIGSELALLSLELAMLSKEFPEKEKFKDVLNSVSSVTNQLRDAIWAIEKNGLTLEDLESRINALLRRHRESKSTIDFIFETKLTNLTHSLTPGQGINLIRIIQEAIQNSIKHSACNVITVKIYTQATTDRLCIEVHDDGNGFDSALIDPSKGEHYGVRNMKKRAEEILGQLEIESGRGKGTKIKVSLLLTC